jgi:hypothetical protein
VAEFQWWLLIVGIVAGGGLVAVVLMNGARREADLDEQERLAEANLIAEWLVGEGRDVSAEDVAAILAAHRTYLELPPPDRLAPVDGAGTQPRPASGSLDADRAPDEVGDDGRDGADQDLASA